MPGSNLPLATLGMFILWLGWFGFNGGSQLAMGTVSDVADVSRIFANTNTAAAGGAIAALILTQVLYKKVDLTMVLNGALAGLVSITAEPLAPGLGLATLIGAVGGVIVVFTVPMLDKMKIDDVVGAIPVHLFAGIWGTLAVVLSNGDATIGAQIYGIVAIGAFMFVASGIFWFILKAVMGIRVSDEDQITGWTRRNWAWKPTRNSATADPHDPEKRQRPGRKTGPFCVAPALTKPGPRRCAKKGWWAIEDSNF